MIYVGLMLIGVFGGAFSVYIALAIRRRQLDVQKSKQEAVLREIEEALDEQKRQQEARLREIEQALVEIESKKKEIEESSGKLSSEREELQSRIISYKELQDENSILKHDLQNIDVNLRKLQLDGELLQEKQDALDGKSKDLGSRYLKENVKWIGSVLNANNFANCKERLLKVIGRCREIGFEVSDDEGESLLVDLRTEFEKAVRAAFEREEQARIKAQIREEQKLEREIEREISQSEREKAAIHAALEKALAEAKDKHSDEVERLRARLAEAEEKAERVKSRAQMTKSGYVYVISNIGSFGEGVYKIGMTRRLEPLDRVRELGDASVPFRFDVHMMISADDAPALENALHQKLHMVRLNKVNHRKEFFRTNFEVIRQTVEAHHGEVEYVADAEALEYRQSLAMSNEDLEYVESVYDKLEHDGQPPVTGE